MVKIILKNKDGAMLLFLAVLLLGIVAMVGFALYNLNLTDKTRMEKIEDAQKAIFLAEKGLSYAYTELREHNSNWFTHKVLPDGSLESLPSASVAAPVVTGAAMAPNGDYLPFGDDSVRVRVYQDATKNIWAVALADYNGVKRVVRVSLVAGSLLEFFHFYTKGHYFRDFKCDGRGFGKIYVNGNINFGWGRKEFRNIALLSTNSTGTIFVQTGNIEPPYYWDDKGGHLDGFAYLPMRDNELYSGFTVGGDKFYYIKQLPQKGSADIYSDSFGVKDPIDYFTQHKWNRGDNRHWGDRVYFIFDQAVMGNKLNLAGQSRVEIKLPDRIYDSSGNPVNYKFDLYQGKDADDVGEKPVKFVRFYKKLVDADGNERWVLSYADDADFAQVFDMKDTKASGMDTVSITYKSGSSWYTRDIPVKEDGITITSYEVKTTKVCDAEGKNCYSKITDVIPHDKVYDVNAEKEWWAAKYSGVHYDPISGMVTVDDPKIKDYIENGFTRKDAEYTTFGYPEYDGFNALNTGYYEHAQRFKDWLKGTYSPPNAKTDELHPGVDLSGIIKEGSTGAISLDPVEVKDTLSYQAKSGGIWIGYEKDVSSGTEQIVIYINGEKKYQGDSLPDWLSRENITTGNSFWYEGNWENTKYKFSVKKVDLLTIDLSKIKSEDGTNILANTNGVIWVNYRKSSDHNDYKKAVRLINGEMINKDAGLTVVTPQSVVVQGSFNSELNYVSDTKPPCAIVTDGDVYVVSKNFSPPDYTPAFSSVIKPYRDARKYLKKKLGANYWPNPDTDCVNLSKGSCKAKLKSKLQKIQKVLIDFYEHELPDNLRRYGAPAKSQLKTLVDSVDLNNKNPDQINRLLDSWFRNAHYPGDAVKIPIKDKSGNIIGYKTVVNKYGENLAPGMVMVNDTVEDRQIYINAAIVSGEYRGDNIKYLENWSWFGGSEYSVPASLRIEGMFPHVMNKTDNSVPDDRWSNLYSKYNLSGSINGGPNPVYIAHDYSNNHPPGDLSYVGLAAYYVEKDVSMFDKHVS